MTPPNCKTDGPMFTQMARVWLCFCLDYFIKAHYFLLNIGLEFQTWKVIHKVGILWCMKHWDG